MNNVRIVILGAPKTGKSMMAKLIASALRPFVHSITIIDETDCGNWDAARNTNVIIDEETKS